jgi:hypothetical protein
VGRSLDPLVGPWRSSRAPRTRVRIAPDGAKFARHGTDQGVELVSLEQLKRKNGEILWRVRWRDARGRNRSRVLGRKRDAEAFDVEIKRRKRTGYLEVLDAGRETLDEYVAGTWSSAHAAHLRPRTRQTYASTYDLHISPRLGGLRLRQIDAEVIAGFQGDLIREGVGPHAIRKAMTLLGGILQRAAESKRIDFNPQRVVRKARLPQPAEVRPLAPASVEAMRAVLPQRDATIVSTACLRRPSAGRAPRAALEAPGRAHAARSRREDGDTPKCPHARPPTCRSPRLAKRLRGSGGGRLRISRRQ